MLKMYVYNVMVVKDKTILVCKIIQLGRLMIKMVDKQIKGYKYGK